jgi:SAM-dependent methyltransferase
MHHIQPTSSALNIRSENERWNSLFAGDSYFYGYEPGPLARRAVRYHRSLRWSTTGKPGNALDAGCGEGQDLLFLAQQGYDAAGIELTSNGAQKTQQLLQAAGFAAQVRQDDLRHCPLESYDLVIAANSVQFLGVDAPLVLQRLIESVVLGGVFGLSLFAREASQGEVEGTIWRTTLTDLQSLMEGWQWLEAANLWQWNTQTNQPQAFLTLIAQRKS